VCDVDLDRTVKAREQFPNAKVYQDWRELLEKEDGNIDSVNVSTPDHMHAAIAMTAMQLGKSVYGQKPLAHDIFEVRRMTEYARQQNLVTQMGIQIHSSPQYRTAWGLIQDGVIGKVKEVHSWCFKSWGDASPRPDRTDPVPANLAWDLWLGVCADRPFIGENYYHPENWRKRLDFGTGSLGDMGCHIFDPVFMALELGTPLSVRSEGPEPNPWNWAPSEKVHYRFAGTERTASDILSFTWYDGDQLPPSEVIALIEGDELPKSGSIFIGTEGVMRLPHIGRATLYPYAKFEDFQYPQIEENNHWCQFVEACRGEGATSADFAYAGPLTEAILLGGIASRFPQTTLGWDSSKMEFDLPEATAFVRRHYRKGWEVKGLSGSNQTP